MSSYNIIETTYSLKTVIEDSDVVEFTNKGGVPHKEVTYLVGHTTFSYMFGGKVIEGECTYPISKVCTVVYSQVYSFSGRVAIKATSFREEDGPIPEEKLNKIINKAVSSSYTSSIISQMSENVNRLYTAIVNKQLASNSRYTVPPVDYKELDSWYTGPGRGAGEINSKGDEEAWEYPVQIGNLLKITQAYYAALTDDQLVVR